jgi:hypothetical protein
VLEDAEAVKDEGVEGVVGLFPSGALEDDTDNLSLLDLGELELRKLLKRIDVILQVMRG